MAEVGRRQEQSQPGIDEEGDRSDVASLNARLVKAEGDGAPGKRLGLLDPAKAFLLGGCDNRAIADHRRSRVVGTEIEA